MGRTVREVSGRTRNPFDPFDRHSARVYARLRLDRALRPPDAIQLACAASAGCNLFITNDERLSRKVVPGVDFIVPLRQVYL